MKKFVLKLILFSSFIIGSLVFVNSLYVRTETYRWSEHMEKFKHIPDNLEIVNFGSSHGLYAFDWSDEQITGFNFALTSQDFYYDLVLLKTFIGHLDKNAIVVLPISYFSFSTDRDSKHGVFYRENSRYYSLLPPNAIFGFNLQDYFLHGLLPVLSAGRKLISILNDSFENTLNKQTNAFEYSQLTEKGKERAQQHLAMINYEKYQVNKNILRELIEFAQSKGLRPILTTTPTTQWYFGNFSNEFLKDFERTVNSIAAEFNIPYLDYSQDPYFATKPELFLDTDHMNAIGRKVFTNMFITDLEKHISTHTLRE